MLGAAVTEIDYSNADADGKICVSYIQAGIPQKTECDAVVVSVPLGVLKSSISGDSGKRDTAAGSGGGGAEEVRWGGGCDSPRRCPAASLGSLKTWASGCSTRWSLWHRTLLFT